MAKKLSKKDLEKIKDKVAKENRSIKRRNEQFAQLSPSEKRVQIARDVLAQLRSKRLIATSGTWLTGDSGDSLYESADIEKNVELQTVLKNREQCEGCALGGMFMCAVERHNKLKIGDLESPTSGEAGEDDAIKYLRKFFSEEQLNEIEAAFEQGGGARSGSATAVNFAGDIDDEEERMRLIMENIIVNKGRFVPSKLPVQAWMTPGFQG